MIVKTYMDMIACYTILLLNEAINYRFLKKNVLTSIQFLLCPPAYYPETLNRMWSRGDPRRLLHREITCIKFN